MIHDERAKFAILGDVIHKTDNTLLCMSIISLGFDRCCVCCCCCLLSLKESSM